MKRIIAISISLLFVFSIVLSACSNGNSDDDSGDSDDSVTLDLYSWRTQDVSGYEKIIDNFENENPNIKIDFQSFKSTEYPQIIRNALASGTGPDIIQMQPNDSIITDNDDLASLDDLDGLDNFNEEFLEVAKDKDGIIRGVPLATNNGVIFYNKDIFDKYDLDEPKTWEEFMDVSKKLKDNDVLPVAQAGKEGKLLSMLHSIIGPTAYGGNDFVDSILSGNAKFTDKEFIESIQRVKDLEPYLPDNFLGLSDDDAKSLFLTEEAAFYINGDYRIGEFKENSPDLNLDVIPGFTSEEEEKPLVTTWVDGSYGVVKTSEHVEEAKKFMEYMTTEEFSQTFSDEFDRVGAVDGVEPSDPILNKVAAANNENSTPYLIVVNFNEGNPATKEVFENSLQGLFTGDLTVDEVAEETQKATDKWFEPKK